MILFNFFIDAIEAFIFPIFISYYFRLDYKLKFIIYSGSVQLLILNIFSYFNQSSFILTLTIILINIISLFLANKKIDFNNVFIVILYNLVILISSTMGLYLEVIFNKISIIKPLNTDVKYIIMCIIAKFILFTVTYIILHFKLNLSLSLDFKKWKLILIYEMILVIGIVNIGYILVMNIDNHISLYILLILLIISNFLFIFIIYKINKLNEINLIYIKEKQLKKFEKEKLITIKNIKNEIDAIDHRLFYVIFQIDNLLKKKEFTKISQLLDKYKIMILKHKMIIDTGNSVFDCLVSLKINDLIINGLDVKTCIFISQNESYNDLNFINFINNILVFFSKCISIQFNLNEINSFVRINILYKNNSINTTRMSEYLNIEIKKFNGYYSFYNSNSENSEIKIILKIGENL